MEKDFQEEYVDCYVCGARGALRVAHRFINLPMEGEAVLLSLKCVSCGFRATDLYPLAEKRESVINFQVKDESDLNRLVYVSSGARIYIPELNLELELKRFDKGFVTTVEGILERFREKALYLCADRQSPGCPEVLQLIENAMRGRLKFSLVIEDPLGRSVILP